MERHSASSVFVTCLLAVLIAVAMFPSDPIDSPTPDRERSPLPEQAAVDPLAARVVLPPAPPLPVPTPTVEVPVAAPEPAPAAMPAPAPAPAAVPADTEEEQTAREEARHGGALQPTAQTVAEGRVLLHLIARGKGPDIEIAWPDDASQRAALYRRMTACQGLMTVLVGSDGTVRGGDGTGAWVFNRDAYSPFMRVVSGPMAPAERARVATLRQKHGNGGTVARVLPRTVDAGVVGTLFTFAEPDGRAPVKIAARYGLDAGGVYLADIEVNGKAVSRTLRVPALARDCR